MQIDSIRPLLTPDILYGTHHKYVPSPEPDLEPAKILLINTTWLQNNNVVFPCPE